MRKDAGTKESKSEADQVPEASVTMTKPAASPKSCGDTPKESNNGTASANNFRPHTLPGGSVTAKPDDTLPVLPTDETPVIPSGETPKPNDEPSEEPTVEPSADTEDETPDDPTPVEPDDPTPAGHDDPTPQEPEEPDPPEVTPPPDDPPYVTMEKDGISAVFLANGDAGTLTLTLMSTGESVEIDVTDWVSQAHAIAQSAQEQEDPLGETPVQAASDPTYTAACFAFDKMIVYSLVFEKNGDVRIYLEVF